MTVKIIHQNVLLLYCLTFTNPIPVLLLWASVYRLVTPMESLYVTNCSEVMYRKVIAFSSKPVSVIYYIEYNILYAAIYNLYGLEPITPTICHAATAHINTIFPRVPNFHDTLPHPTRPILFTGPCPLSRPPHLYCSAPLVLSSLTLNRLFHCSVYSSPSLPYLPHQCQPLHNAFL